MVRCPPTNDVVPLSPVIVYRLLFFISSFLGINGYIVREVRNRFWHPVRCGKDPDGRIARNFLCAAVLFAEQWVEQALCVTDDNGFVVCAEHFCREGVEKFVDSPYSAGKGHEYGRLAR